MFYLSLFYTNGGYADPPEAWPTYNAARAEAVRRLRATPELDRVRVFKPRTGPGVYVRRDEV